MTYIRRYLTLENLGYFDTIASVLLISVLNSASTNAEMVLLGGALVVVHFLLFGMIGWVQYLEWEGVSRLFRADLAICAVGLGSAAALPFVLYVAAFAVLLLVHLWMLRETSRRLDVESTLDVVNVYRQPMLQLVEPVPGRKAQQ